MIKMKLIRAWLTLLVMTSGKADSVLVLRFQEDGLATPDSVAMYEGELVRSREMYSLTLCARFQIFFLHTRAVFFQLHDTQLKLENMLLGEVLVERVRFVMNNAWNYQLLEKELWAFRWHHLCFTYDHPKNLISTYLDGELNNQQEFVLLSPVYGDWARLGQNFEASNSFSGDLTQVNVWDRVLTDEEILAFARCETNPKGSYISWEAGWSLKVVSTYDLPLAQFCQQEVGTSYFWFPSVPEVTAHYVCEALGTHLPWAENIDDVYTLQKVSAAAYPDFGNCHFNFWMSLTDKAEENVWRSHDGKIVEGIFWAPYEPNGLRYENCAALSRYGVADINCDMQIRCAVCTFIKQHRFSLLGICEQELRNVYFVAYQENINELIFIGYGEYHIRRLEDQWTWVDVVNNLTVAHMEETVPDFPMGRRWWRLEREVCGQKAGGRRRLSLSPCPHHHYSCDDATCIPIHHRCDLKYDCRDNSDELDCHLISFPRDYQRHLPPRLSGEDDVSLPIILNVTMETIAVQTLDMTMEIAYEVAMTWMDNRLNYLNLKVNDSLNKLHIDTVRKLWIPQVNFINTDNIHRTHIDEDVVMFIHRSVNDFFMDKAAPAEVEVYDGKVNSLTIRRKYGTIYKCNFDLALYPFDVQQCEMRLRITSELKSFLIFDQWNSSVEYLSNPFLVEYEVSASLPKTSYFKMVDIWLIFCIGITFLVIIYHALVDNFAHPDPSTSLVKTQVFQVVPMTGSAGQTKAIAGERTRRMVLFTKITVPLVFFIFNICYWGYIFAN